jgi:hypothetical protein
MGKKKQNKNISIVKIKGVEKAKISIINNYTNIKSFLWPKWLEPTHINYKKTINIFFTSKISQNNSKAWEFKYKYKTKSGLDIYGILK